MVYGKLFRKFQSKYDGFENLSNNRCSLLTYKELKEMAKVLYKDYPEYIGYAYMRQKYDELARRVYITLCNL